MSSTIRGMEERDRARVLEMMREFYASPAVLSSGSEEIFNADIDHCVGDCPYIEGYIFEDGSTIQGYAMVARSYSAGPAYGLRICSFASRTAGRESAADSCAVSNKNIPTRY